MDLTNIPWRIRFNILTISKILSGTKGKLLMWIDVEIFECEQIKYSLKDQA